MDCYFLLQGSLPDPGIEPASPALAEEFFTRVIREAHLKKKKIYLSAVLGLRRSTWDLVP